MHKSNINEMLLAVMRKDNPQRSTLQAVKILHRLEALTDVDSELGKPWIMLSSENINKSWLGFLQAYNWATNISNKAHSIMPIDFPHILEQNVDFITRST